MLIQSPEKQMARWDRICEDAGGCSRRRQVTPPMEGVGRGYGRRKPVSPTLTPSSRALPGQQQAGKGDCHPMLENPCMKRQQPPTQVGIQAPTLGK